MKLLAFLIICLLTGAFFIISNYNLNLGNKEDRDIFSSMYWQWISGILKDPATTAGYFIKMEWLPKEAK